MSPNDVEPALRRRLARHRAVATGLLALMAAGAAASLLLPHGFWPGLLRGATRAGLIGGVADWFAVTALFRQPLGLPIPHTAVIPRQKARLGRALGHFVATHVFTEAELLRLIGRLDLPRALGRVLAEADTRRGASVRIAAIVPVALAGVSDGRAGALLGAFVPNLFDGRELGVVMGRALRALVAGDRHQAVVTFVVAQLRQALRAKEAQLRTLIEERVREQGGRLVGWALGGSIASRVLAAMNSELEGIDPESPELRNAVDLWIGAQIALFEADPDRAAVLGRQLRGLVGNEAITMWGGDVWLRFRRAVERDAMRADGHVALLIDEMLARLSSRLIDDGAVRARADAIAATALVRALPSGRTRLADFIGTVVAGWEDRMLIDKLELRVGRDLQYIRINGTLVGFLVGAAIFALLGPG